LELVKKINSNLTGGAEFKHDINNQKYGFAFGGNYKIDDKSTVKSKFDDKGNFSVSYIVSLNDKLKTNVTVESGLKNIRENTGSKLNVGFIFENLD